MPLILIDAGHNNIGVDPRGSRAFVNDLVAHGYNVLFNLDELTATDLNTEVVKLLILNAYGPNPLTEAEIGAVADFVAAGGSLWLNGMSDYTGKVWWAYSVADRMNGLLSAIETRTGLTIPVRFNDDEVLDGNDNNGYPWGVLWHVFPVSPTTGVGMNVLRVQSWSVASLVDRNPAGADGGGPGRERALFVVGDLDSGSGTYGYPNRTSNIDADGEGDAYIYGATELIPGAAGYDLPGPAGRLFLYGDSNDPFNIFAYGAGDGKQNELFNLETVMWLLGEPLQKKTVAEARYDPEEDDSPLHRNKLVWVEGFVTASYGEFFDVLYVQDETGGITVFAPAGTASGAVGSMPVRGDCVRVVGTVDVYQGDTEIQFFESEQVQVLTPTCVLSPTLAVTGSVPLPLRTISATLEAYEGWLAVVSGTVTAVSGDRSAIWVDDGSGPVRAFLDGYNGTWEGVYPLDRVQVAGLVSEDNDGPRLRVRNYRMHPDRPDDLRVLIYNLRLSKRIEPDTAVRLGSVVTYTLVLTNPNEAAASVVLTDVLPAAVAFGGWVEQPGGAEEAGGTITWTAVLEGGASARLTFTATVNVDYGLYGQRVTNTARFFSEGIGEGNAEAAFTVIGPPSLAVSKTVAPEADVPLGGVVTCTVVLSNSGAGDALGVVLTDALPAEVTFGGWVQQKGAIYESGVITWTGTVAGSAEVTLVFTATLSDRRRPLQTAPLPTPRPSSPPTPGGVATATFATERSGEASAAFTVIGAPSLTVSKSVAPTADVPLGGVVTCTVVLSNSGAGDALGVVLTDALPAEVTFGGWVQQNGAIHESGVITWTGAVAGGAEVTLVFTATLGTDAGLYNRTVANTASFVSANAGSGAATATFATERRYWVYLPLVLRSARP